MEENSYRCEACGGTMVFDPVSQKLKCPNCDSEIEIIHDEARVVEHTLTIDAMRQQKATEKTTKTMECTGCGAKIEIGANETAAKCPYCDATYVLAGEQESTLIPDAVLPFKVDKNELGGIFQSWMKGKWLAPGDLKNLYQRDSFQGIYIPFWTFDANGDANFTAMGGKRRRVKDENGEEKTVTDWYPTSGHVHKFFDDMPAAASDRYRKGLFRGLEPFAFDEMKSYSPDYFSGHMSENYSISLEDGHKDAINRMTGELKSMAEKQVCENYDCVKDVHMRPVFKDETYKYVMVPVYSTAYQYKNKTYTVLINGHSGRVQGEYPKSPVKIIMLILLAALVLGAIWFFGGRKSNETDAAMAYENSVYAKTIEHTAAYISDSQANVADIDVDGLLDTYQI